MGQPAGAEEDRLAQEQARRQRAARAANTRLNAATDRFGHCGRSEPATAERLRQQAEAILVELGTVSADTWPWHALALGVRDQPAIIPSKGPPRFGGAKVLLWGQTFEVGRVDGPVGRTGAVPQREPGELMPRSYELRGADLKGELAALEPGRVGPALAWSETLDQQAQLEPGFSPYWPFTRRGLLDLPQASLDALWPSLKGKIVAWIKSASGIHHHGRSVEEGAELVPLVWNDALRVVPLKAAAGPLGAGNARLLGPTTAGW